MPSNRPYEGDGFMSKQPEHDRMNINEAADFLRISFRTLNKWRSTQEVNLPYSKVGRRVLYSRKALEEYLAAHTFNKTEGDDK